jgi:hypothetical protein
MRQYFVALLAAAHSLVGCGDDDHPPALESTVRPEDPGPSRPRPVVPLDRDAATLVDSGTAGSGPSDAGPTGDSGSETNCGAITCRGHGACAVVAERATCVCDFGYVAEGEGQEFECVVDRSCRRLRPLEEGCRVIVGGPPAVAAFFAVDYCAGSAVLPDDLGDLDEAFDIHENGMNILENEESVATVIERDVESYVAIALDVSKSVTGVEGDTEKQRELTALIREVRAFVGALRSPQNQPPVTLSVLVFGRFVEEYVPYTTDLDAVDRALARIESDPDQVVELVGGDGTALYEGVSRGIDSVERIQSLRNLVTSAGVLTTGTLVVITDGRDSSNAQLDAQRISDTRVNLISVGISSDIDDVDLGAIGRDGSFLAPERRDWADAFSEIAQRVAEYPERAYLLAYCSSATSGDVTVSIGLREQPVDSSASCIIGADGFSNDASDVCDLSLFARSCESAECGTIFACGDCPNQQCCAGNTCQAPGVTERCLDQDALCAPDGQVCTKVDPAPDDEIDAHVCAEPFGVGADCSDNDYCAPGISSCEKVSDDLSECIPVTLREGDVCGNADDFKGSRCPEENCSQKSETNATDPYVCRREARLFERCSGTTADARCESGALCEGSTCAARDLWSCAKHEDCLSGYCDENTKLCLNVGECPFNWTSKVAN